MRAGWILLPVCVALGCEGASADNGLTARLRLNGAQFVPGALQPAPDATGPVAMASPSVAKLYPGVQNIPLGGSVVGGTSVLLGFAGDTGYWIVPAPLLDVSSTPDEDRRRARDEHIPTASSLADAVDAFLLALPAREGRP